MNTEEPLFAVENGVLTEYHGSGGDVVIPEGVRIIASGVFRGCTALHSVTIPEGVREIEGDFFSGEPSGAFSDCTGLVSVHLPESLREIGCRTFSGCTALSSLTLPAGLKRMGNRAFQNCTALRSVTIPGGIAGIDYGVFMGCRELESVTLPRSLVVIREEAFADCSALETVFFPPFLRLIDYSAFRNCKNLSFSAIPGTVREIGSYAFENCSALSVVNIGGGTEKIGRHAFRGCPELSLRIRSGSAAETYAKNEHISFAVCDSLKDAAMEMLHMAYIPYSHFPVGAALECEDGTVFCGCNVESAAYPAGMCAERNALGQAVSKGYRRFSRIVIAGTGHDFCMPCGVCRQALTEFSPDMEVICLNGSGEEKSYYLRDLLPRFFGPHSMER